ncbi:MAG: hypothetical protein IKZ95_05165, partial [Lachnospiraceae bacterium]|nr:hypothetical protein [Lachnospiraceae bacterium]
MKKILAWIAIVLLVLLYLATLICVLINSPLSMSLFKASVALTIIIPVLIYGILLIRRVLRDRVGDSDKNIEKNNDKND